MIELFALCTILAMNISYCHCLYWTVTLFTLLCSKHLHFLWRHKKIVPHEGNIAHSGDIQHKITYPSITCFSSWFKPQSKIMYYIWEYSAGNNLCMKISFGNYLLIAFWWCKHWALHFPYIIYINSSWPSDAIWRYRSGSTLAQVMACCLTAPSHYLNQCWLIIREVFWHSTEGNFTGNVWDIYPWYAFVNHRFTITDASPRHQLDKRKLLRYCVQWSNCISYMTSGEYI